VTGMYGQTAVELLHKLRQVRLLITDCDGVLTDGGVYYSDTGECLKRFNIRDGMAVERLRTVLGIEVGIISGELSSSLRRRAEKLAIKECHLGVQDKSLTVYALADRRGYGLEQIAYIGDDVNDLAVMSVVGVSACPGDAMEKVKFAADYVCIRTGGNGAFREFAELIIQAHLSTCDGELSVPVGTANEQDLSDYAADREQRYPLLETDARAGC
jgi:3-deoxy-D-manno-octulosonate 8-phosphate phosphatase (KDO 8-P phosphatase)